MITRRRVVLALGAGALAPLASFAQQQSGKVFRIGFLGAGSASGFATRVEAFRAGLRELGYVEGKNIAIEFRWAENKNERLPELAGELVRLRVDVIVTSGTPPVLALKRATSTIPIVMASSGDAVRAGLVASLARPGGNVTGLTFFGPELYAKRLELLKEAIPRIRVVAHLMNPENPVYQANFAEANEAAKQLKMQLLTFEARHVNDFEAAFSSMAKKHVDAVLVAQDNLFTSNHEPIASLAAKQRLPSTGFAELAEAGGLIGYGANTLNLFRRSAAYVDKILKGMKPADLPVERPTKFDLIVNVKTAQALGLKIPQSILVQATKVIE